MDIHTLFPHFCEKKSNLKKTPISTTQKILQFLSVCAAHFIILGLGQNLKFRRVCVAAHLTFFLGGPANGIKRVVSNPKAEALEEMAFSMAYDH